MASAAVFYMLFCLSFPFAWSISIVLWRLRDLFLHRFILYMYTTSAHWLLLFAMLAIVTIWKKRILFLFMTRHLHGVVRSFAMRWVVWAEV